MSHDDDEPLDSTVNTGAEIDLDPAGEINAVLDDLSELLKNGDVIAALTVKGVNASIALLAVDGLRHYLANRKEEAAEDLATVTEEIRGRLAAAEPGGGNGKG